MKIGLNTFVLLLFVSMLAALPAVAIHPQGRPPQGGWKPGAGLTLGAGSAYVHGGVMERAFSPSVALSLFRKIKSPFNFWASAGGKLVTASETVFLPFVETGINILIFNVGAGYALGVPDAMGIHHLNLFLGVSIPVYIPKRGRVLYAQLYYRPILTLPASDFPASHEMGLMLKWLMVLP